ncbi:phytanoyl-CoA dioxygenase family protein [Paenibacillus cymbidii]|uniref:phytanoyl-CoA dioxygenase family protein n=1 Tax=Paenibacillus cymbidii TaxID=1639034 RepID=UPI00107FD5AC|nr:phytanoyl-CoA dioxygenase family protein [Paenibacillus cymbidii]
MKLDQESLEAYKRDGYLKYGRLLEPGEVIALQEAYMASLEKMREERRLVSARHGETADGRQTEVFQIRSAHLHHPLFNKLMRDPRLLDIVESLIGPNIRLVLFQGLYKPPHTGGVIEWHQDDFYFMVDRPDAVVSCWLALDDATVDNGCMWVVPGRQHTLLEHYSNKKTNGAEIVGMDETGAVPVELKAGQCMFHHGLTPHRTLANTSGTHRRALAIHFMDALAVPLGEGRKKEPAENMPVLRGSAVSW